ncbi:MAG: phage Gp37/Gp68 family protein [Okeania sp. SIO2D1]|nr:phage Gp37/Gp68 family protein [Okeania sp. SIO2D1]
MGDTNIQWTSYTWNPVTGCEKVSPGCANCYAERLANTRLKRYYPEGFHKVTLHPERLKQPLKLKKSREIFVNSMSDLFNRKVPDSFILIVLGVIRECPQHNFQVLTKRAERMQRFMSRLWLDSDVPMLNGNSFSLTGEESTHKGWDNLWLGVSVENQDFVHRIDYLRKTPAKVRFLSCEPLLGELKLDLKDIHWVIVGGESGFNHRPMKAEWAQSIRDQCLEAGVPFFFKQWGGRTSKANGRMLDGREWNEKPGFVAEVA